MNFEFLYDIPFLKQLYQQDNIEEYVKIISFNLEEEPQEELTGRATSGSVNVDGSSSLRRTCQLSLVCQEGQTATDAYWGLRTIFKVYKGIKNFINSKYDDICWFPQGVFVIQQFSSQYDENGLTVNITGKDKMCLLNGELGGNLPVTVDFSAMGGLGDLKENTLIYDIIREAVHVWGNEHYRNIIINDIAKTAFNIMEYRGEGKQLLIKPDGNSYSVEFTDEPRNPLKDIYGYGDTVGYQLTDFVYPGEKTAAADQPVTTGILDPIIELLGNYEYFYDINGRFVFQEKRNYLNNTWSPEINNGNDIENGYMYLSPYSFEFDDAKLIKSYERTPNLANIKNDFVVWGTKKTTSGSSIPVHMRLSVNDKPYKQTIPEKYWNYLASPGGWRHALYKMALDNVESPYKIYYADILEFWDQLFTVPNQEQVFVAIEKVYLEYKENDIRYPLACEIYEIYENRGKSNLLETLKYLQGYDEESGEFWYYDLSLFNTPELIESIYSDDEIIIPTIENIIEYKKQWTEADKNNDTEGKENAAGLAAIEYQKLRDKNQNDLANFFESCNYEKALSSWSFIKTHFFAEWEYEEMEFLEKILKCKRHWDWANDDYEKAKTNFDEYKARILNFDLNPAYLRSGTIDIKEKIREEVELSRTYDEASADYRIDQKKYIGFYSNRFSSSALELLIQLYWLCDTEIVKKRKIEEEAEELRKKYLKLAEDHPELTKLPGLIDLSRKLTTTEIISLKRCTGIKIIPINFLMEQTLRNLKKLCFWQPNLQIKYQNESVNEVKIHYDDFIAAVDEIYYSLIENNHMIYNKEKLTLYKALGKLYYILKDKQNALLQNFLEAFFTDKGIKKINKVTTYINEIVYCKSLWTHDEDNKTWAEQQAQRFYERLKSIHQTVIAEDLTSKNEIQAIDYMRSGEYFQKILFIVGEEIIPIIEKAEDEENKMLFDFEKFYEQYQKIKASYYSQFFSDEFQNITIQDILNPEDLIFWIDILDNNSEISQYKISKIGLRTKATTDKDVTAISYRDIPTVVFVKSDEEITDLKQVQDNTIVNLPKGYDLYFYLSTRGSKTAYSVIEEYLYNYLYFADTISISTVPILHLEPNTTIFVSEGQVNIGGDYIVNSFSIPLASGEFSTISASKSVERLY